DPGESKVEPPPPDGECPCRAAKHFYDDCYGGFGRRQQPLLPELDRCPARVLRTTPPTPRLLQNLFFDLAAPEFRSGRYGFCDLSRFPLRNSPRRAHSIIWKIFTEYVNFSSPRLALWSIRIQ